ncbi:MAG: signal transduction histidine kinase, partial [Pseudohongiellaceae bacterium]
MSAEELQPAAEATPDGPDEPLRGQALSARQRRAGLLVGDLVHDLRNPLAVIQGYAQLLLTSTKVEADARDLERILDETARMSELLTSVVDFLHPEHPGLSEVSLERVIALGMGLSRQRARQCQVAISVHRDDSPAVVLGRFGALVQVFSATLEYAVEQMTPGQQLSVCSCRSVSGQPRLIISHGATPQDGERARAFIPNTASEPTELPLCQELLASYGGSLK